MKYLLIVILLAPTTAYSQELSNKLSYATVIANLTIDTIYTLRAEDKKDAIRKQVIKTSIIIAASEVLKRIVHETRPDGSDDKSWPSEHSALSCVSISFTNVRRLTTEFPLALGTMVGRVQANRHSWLDVLSGCALGLTAGLVVQ